MIVIVGLVVGLLTVRLLVIWGRDLLDAPALQPLTVDAAKRFDLVILAYQVWFLSPSLPVTAFLKSDAAKRLLRDTPVVTVIACRNMWLMAQEQVKAMLAACGARLVGNVALVDEAEGAIAVSTSRIELSPRATLAQTVLTRGAKRGGAILTVEVEERDGGAARVRQRRRRSLEEKSAVREPGEGVVSRLIRLAFCLEA